MKSPMRLGIFLLVSCFQISHNHLVRRQAEEQNTNLLSDLDPTCSSQIYCHGKLLDVVQMAHLYPDSKTFVDMKMKYSVDETLKNFDNMMSSSPDDKPDNETIKQFVEDNFAEPGAEFENWVLTDWKEKPRFLDLIRDPDLRQWGNDLHLLWRDLGRKMIDDVTKNPEQYSIIHVDNPVVVPGGRFREFYYWDSYWIVRGLLYSDMFETVRGMIQNFLAIVEKYGFIPNGGRIYYSRRSQPPLLAGMIKAYVDFTGDEKLAIESVKTLELEFQYWMNNHTHEIKDGHFLSTYGDKSSGPRPESYREDVIGASKFNSAEAKQEHYSELKAAAESGMDFSSRWFIASDGSNSGDLSNLKTRSIVPVELNAMLFWNARIIAEFYLKAGNLDKSAEYEKKAQKIYDAIQAVLWHEDIGAWLDYDILNNKRREYFVATNLSPLWLKCFNISDSEKISELVLKYIEKTGIDKYPGGVPQTLVNTGQQWDFPNVWPPIQYMLIMGLNNLGTPAAKELSEKWAKRWVQSNFEAYKATRSMFEKYDAEVFGGSGGGGEYENQKGFGWTNGIIVEFLVKYGDTLRPYNSPNSDKTNGTSMTKLSVISGFIIAAAALLTSTVGRFLW